MYISYCQLHSVVNRALIFHIIALVLILSLSPSVEGLPLPWCTDPTIRARPCANNDTYCGNWFGRQYTPNNCKYREITNEQARMCVGERTIACLGDSIIRDMCVGLAMYLAGEKVEEGSEEQYHKILDNHQTRYMNSTKIGWVRSWKANRPGHNAFVFPKVNEATGPSPFKWQVQVWEQQRNPLVVAHAEDILSGKVRKEHPVLRSVDFAFWGHGLHEQPLWNTSPHGDLFYENIVSHWIDIRKRVQVPLVWTSINPHCLLQMPRFNLNSVLFPLQVCVHIYCFIYIKDIIEHYTFYSLC